jgi:hypothetical protein
LNELHNRQIEKLEKLQADDIKMMTPKFGIDDTEPTKDK